MELNKLGFDIGQVNPQLHTYIIKQNKAKFICMKIPQRKRKIFHTHK